MGLNPKKKIEGSRKLTHRFIGLFEIVKKIGKVAYELKLTQGMLMHDVFHVSLLRPYKNQGERPPPAVLPTGIIEYEVEKILKHEDDADNQRYYFVKWTGFEVPTWEPEEGLLNCRNKIHEYFTSIGEPYYRLKRLPPVPAAL